MISAGKTTKVYRSDWCHRSQGLKCYEYRKEKKADTAKELTWSDAMNLLWNSLINGKPIATKAPIDKKTQE